MIGGHIRLKKLLARWSFTPSLLAWELLVVVPVGAALEGINERLVEIPLVVVAGGWMMLGIAVLSRTDRPSHLSAPRPLGSSGHCPESWRAYTRRMALESLAEIDFSSWDEPEAGLEPRLLLEGWLKYQRHEFLRKLRDLSPQQMVAWSIPPVELSDLGLVRHMTQIEHGGLAWGLGGGEKTFRYGEEDYAGGSVETVDGDLRWYFEEVARSNEAIVGTQSLDATGRGHGKPLRAILVKMIDEYAIHAGQGRMLRFAALGELSR